MCLMCSLAWAFAGRKYDKYPVSIAWIICSLNHIFFSDEKTATVANISTAQGI